MHLNVGPPLVGGPFDPVNCGPATSADYTHHLVVLDITRKALLQLQDPD
jgi:hypothetical protein